MLFPNDIESKLGFDKIRERLAVKCKSAMGTELAEKVRFTADIDLIRKFLQQTDDFKKILESDGAFPSNYYLDARPALAKARVEGAFLDERQFRDISLSLTTIDSCVRFLKSHKEEYPSLYELTNGLEVSAALVKSIDAKIDDDPKVRDNASAVLQNVRRNISQKYQQVRKTLESAFKSAAKEGFIPDGASITVRDGRMVIPVSAEYKRRIKGFVHDESSTGQTVFIEPATVLEGNNELRELEYAEKREVIKILTELTDELRANTDSLKRAYRFLGVVDFIQAKARLALELDAVLPAVKEEQTITWKEARHPLLFLAHRNTDKKVVPLNIELNHDQRLLIISGPNAGGKSVCLKTVGLLQLMLQSGLLVPVGEESEFGVFEDIFIDIGDEQSIENDLSTYSSHLSNMKFFIRNAKLKSLCLIDEFGTGTDPQFGGAIAEAVLDDLKRKEANGVITTHYSNIKNYAEEKPGLINGAMKYDMANLEPLYELEMGKPGSSFSLEIARKIGLSHKVIEYAKEAIGSKNIDVDNLLLRLERQKQKVIERDRALKSKEKEVSQLQSKYQRLLEEMETNKKSIISKAKQEAASILKETNREIEKTIRHIKENKAEKKETKRVRERLTQLKGKVEEEKKVIPAVVQKEDGPIGIGDAVRIVGQEVAGEVLSLKGNGAEVQFGDLKSTVKLNRLEKISKGQSKQINKQRSQPNNGLNLNQKFAQFSSTLDVRGRRAEEVFSIVDRFIDDALLFDISEIRILHGKGDGVLRSVIRDYLRKSNLTETITDEHVERGGAGITVVQLK
ncbi:endonuclease MutS2 [Fulvivirga sp. M361]|uniref:endonuclease MutS2 n=1 Tax=Fulvivirga sp. M361 TaxID=2594266 RepID=UPI00117B1DC2|nr:endonuclease MutS2 [Fulvivirga sp. M361]TRX49855.1 endonuclease MutS2 [Fulvivirga sp. M361]